MLDRLFIVYGALNAPILISLLGMQADLSLRKLKMRFGTIDLVVARIYSILEYISDNVHIVLEEKSCKYALDFVIFLPNILETVKRLAKETSPTSYMPPAILHTDLCASPD